MAHAKVERFRHNLELLCAEHGRVQEVAKSAKVSRVYLSKIIHGHSVPTLEVAAKLADSLGFPLSELLEKKIKKLAAAG